MTHAMILFLLVVANKQQSKQTTTTTKHYSSLIGFFKKKKKMTYFSWWSFSIFQYFLLGDLCKLFVKNVKIDNLNYTLLNSFGFWYLLMSLIKEIKIITNKMENDC